jgi:hypothetical protein
LNSTIIDVFVAGTSNETSQDGSYSKPYTNIVKALASGIYGSKLKFFSVKLFLSFK